MRGFLQQHFFFEDFCYQFYCMCTVYVCTARWKSVVHFYSFTSTFPLCGNIKWNFFILMHWTKKKKINKKRSSSFVSIAFTKIFVYLQMKDKIYIQSKSNFLLYFCFYDIFFFRLNCQPVFQYNESNSKEKHILIYVVSHFFRYVPADNDDGTRQKYFMRCTHNFFFYTRL